MSNVFCKIVIFKVSVLIKCMRKSIGLIKITAFKTLKLSKVCLPFRNKIYQAPFITSCGCPHASILSILGMGNHCQKDESSMAKINKYWSPSDSFLILTRIFCQYHHLKALQRNGLGYPITIFTSTACRLLSSLNLQNSLLVLIDWYTIRAWLKLMAHHLYGFDSPK